ncbi:ATP-binding protein [Bdellovibrionota bacterium FG-1]
MDILGQSALLVGVTSFALGLSTLSRNVKNKLYIGFSALTTLISGWGLCFFLEKIWSGGTFYRWHLFFGVWLVPAALAFIRLMTRIEDRLSRRLLEISILLSLMLTAALGLHLERESWVLSFMYLFPVLVVLQLVQLMWIDRRLRRGLKRLPKLPTVGFGRRNLIYLGGLSALAFSVMDHVPWLGTVVPSIGNLLLVVYVFFMSQAISQQRLLNFGALLSRVLVLVAVALTLTGVYSLLVAWIQNSPELFFLNSFIASFLILTLLDPLRSLVRYFTQRLLTQKHQRLEQTLREAQRKLVGVVDPVTLFQGVLLFVQQTIQPEWAAVFILRSDGTKYRRVRLVGNEAGGADGRAKALREILADHPMLHHCADLYRKGELPVLLDQVLENEIDRSASRVQREQLAGLIQGLKALGGNLLIPFFDSGQILGFVALSALSPPEPWGSNWGLLPIIYPYFEQVGQAMRSLEVYVRSREKERLATLGEMAAGLAHEIRNPLGAIKGAAQFLDPGVDRPESHFLKIIIEEVDRLNRVVTQFLEYSKPPKLELQSVDVSSMAARTVEMMRTGLQDVGAPSLVFATAPTRYGRQTQVLGAPEQLQQVLINLIQNSVKAVEQKPSGTEKVIRVSVDREGQGKNAEVTLSVEDNGVGIKKENLEKLFIPFFTTSPSGTGLGLSISQKIIEAHRGRIEVATEEGRFTRFSLVLPALE